MEFDFLNLVILLLLSTAFGAVAQSLLGYRAGGILVTLTAGLLGIYIGLYLEKTAGVGRLITLRVGGHLLDVVYSLVGSVLFLIGLGVVRGHWKSS